MKGKRAAKGSSKASPQPNSSKPSTNAATEESGATISTSVDNINSKLSSPAIKSTTHFTSSNERLTEIAHEYWLAASNEKNIVVIFMQNL
jgi:hypothetical protein